MPETCRWFTLALIDAFGKGKDSNAPILSQKPPVNYNYKLSVIQAEPVNPIENYPK
jgi:hypothetical protein